MDLIDQEIDNCIAVTRRLLLLARPPANSLQLVVLNEALTDTLRLLEFDAQTRKIGQVADLPATPLRVLADEAEIRMIFLNLMQNAHHAMPDGGTLTARLTSRDGHAVLEIIDTGIGMAPEQVHSIFDPFFSRRADGVAGLRTGPDHRQELRRADGRRHRRAQRAWPRGLCFRIRLALAETVMETSS